MCVHVYIQRECIPARNQATQICMHAYIHTRMCTYTRVHAKTNTPRTCSSHVCTHSQNAQTHTHTHICTSMHAYLRQIKHLTHLQLARMYKHTQKKKTETDRQREREREKNARLPVRNRRPRALAARRKQPCTRTVWESTMRLPCV